jgi:hypothetical protein
MQSLLNPKLSKCVGHIPLAFSPDDKERLTDQFMERLAKEYMKAMGIENTQYIIVRHNNTNHPHCHIVFNRVDNDGKTISDKNDRYRNEKVCKQLKDRYNLTYGTGKDKVNIQHLKGAEQTKYEIYHAVNNILPKAKNWQQFESLLGKQGISINYKYKGQTDKCSISIRKGNTVSRLDIDRQFIIPDWMQFWEETATVKHRRSNRYNSSTGETTEIPLRTDCNRCTGTYRV